MKRFAGFLIKEFIHIFRDIRTMMILFAIPVFQILIFGYVIKNEIQDVKVGVLDFSGSPHAVEMINRIDASADFEVVSRYYSYPEAEEAFRRSEVKEVIVIGSGFDKDLHSSSGATIQLMLDASDPNMANLINSYTTAMIMKYIAGLNNNGISLHRPSVETRMWYNENLKSSYMFVPGTMALILMLITAMMSSISIVREKENGTMEVLLASPLNRWQIIFGKVTPYILISVVNACSVIAIGNLVFGVPIHGSLWLLFGETLLFIFLALCFGIFISSAVKSQMMAMFISMFVLMLPTLLLSGFIFPIENMPVVLQWLSVIIPAKYFLLIIKMIMLKGGGLADVWKPTLVLLGMSLFFLGMSIKKFKARLE
ncbi:MAG: ABC transporter permease [Bacteroidales bacterium]|nr:ABC transporter permease [Bacteroidales bacterium]HOY37999.1 ABC transporter permease [Bacteroidales bacterium]HQP04319.1 ABC transporter permease [Bacteroidales bacterium]